MHDQLDTAVGGDVSTSMAYGDLMTATVFVFIITLVAYVINFSSNQEHSHSLGQKVSDTIARQSFIVGRVEQRLKQNRVSHSADAKEGLIRISAKDLAFEPGSFQLQANEVRKIRAIAGALALELPCYAQPDAATSQRLACGEEQKGQLQAVAIEGHTDNTPITAVGDGIRTNTDLSLMRAATVLSYLTDHPDLSDLKNKEGNTIFHAAGYGEMHPLNRYDQPVSDIENRRIEIRIVLEKPWALN